MDIFKSTYTNKEGEVKTILRVSCPDKGKHILLTKKKADGTRMNPDEMIAWMRAEAPDWRKRTELVDGEFGKYWNISGLTYEEEKISI